VRVSIAIAAALSLQAETPAAKTDTVRFQVPESGTIRLENSFGDVHIEGWDKTEVELMVVKSDAYSYGAGESSKSAAPAR
jgi:hypothetical protein